MLDYNIVDLMKRLKFIGWTYENLMNMALNMYKYL